MGARRRPVTSAALVGHYDAFGQPGTRVEAATPRRGDPHPIHLVTRTSTAYASPTKTAFIVDRVASATVEEVVDDGSRDLVALLEAAEAGAMATRIVRQTVNFYDGAAFTGLEAGKVADGGAGAGRRRSRSPSTACTSFTAAAPLPCRRRRSHRTWPGAAPRGRTSTRRSSKARHGYTFLQNGAGAGTVPGYFVDTERRRYDFHAGAGRGVITATKDALGADTAAHDGWGLPVLVTTSPHLKQAAEYDYRTLQPSLVTDANGNRTAYVYTALGLLAAVAVMGKPGAEEGDTVDQPGVRYVYDLAPYPETRRPISVHEIRRQRHRWDLVRDANATRAQQNLPPLTPAEIDAMFGPDELAAHPERFVQTRAFSDGFGRVVQTRTEREPISFGDAGLSPSPSEPAPPATGTSATGIAVVVSGWQLYDDKGRPVVKQEPFFSTGWNFAEPTTADLGALQRSTLAYDPLGRLVRTINPDGSSSRMVHGVPGTLAAPDLASDAFEPTPWERWSYDESDNGGRTPATAGASNQTHWNTPSSVILDALQRPVVSVDRSGMAATDSLRSESRYDITGNLISVSDPLGRTAFAYAHDLLGRRWREQTLDGGVRRVVFDAVGLRSRSGTRRSAAVYRAGLLGSPGPHLGAGCAGHRAGARERIVYGDDPASGHDAAGAAAANLSAGLVVHYDEAGLATVGACDFKGNVLERRAA